MGKWLTTSSSVGVCLKPTKSLCSGPEIHNFVEILFSICWQPFFSLDLKERGSNGYFFFSNSYYLFSSITRTLLLFFFFFLYFPVNSFRISSNLHVRKTLIYTSSLVHHIGTHFWTIRQSLKLKAETYKH